MTKMDRRGAFLVMFYSTGLLLYTAAYGWPAGMQVWLWASTIFTAQIVHRSRAFTDKTLNPGLENQYNNERN